MADDNTSVVRRLLEEVWAAGTLDAAEELIGKAYRSHVPDVSDARMSHWTGPNIVRVEVAAYRSAFPDLAVEVGALVAEGDAVAAYWNVRGTNTGTLRRGPFGEDVFDEEVEPSGKELSASASTLFRLTEGKITEAAFGWHPLGLLDQVRLYAKGSQVIDLGGGNRVSLVIPPD